MLNTFGDEWAEKWKQLDKAFELQVKSLSDDGKLTGHSIRRMMTALASISNDADDPFFPGFDVGNEFLSGAPASFAF